MAQSLKGGGPADGGSVPSAVEEVSAYETARQERIAANRQLLVDLGLASALEGLQSLKQDKTAPKDEAGASGPQRKRKSAPEDSQPARRSKRISGEGREEAPEEAVQEFEEIEKAQPRPRVQAGRSWEQRMAELKMGSLVDLSRQQAVFIVVGSTDKHYKVQLSNTASKCGCRDFRIRGKQRPCKHLRLLMQNLGVEEHPGGWHGAVTAYLDKQLDAS